MHKANKTADGNKEMPLTQEEIEINRKMEVMMHESIGIRQK